MMLMHACRVASAYESCMGTLVLYLQCLCMAVCCFQLQMTSLFACGICLYVTGGMSFIYFFFTYETIRICIYCYSDQ